MQRLGIASVATALLVGAARAEPPVVAIDQGLMQGIAGPVVTRYLGIPFSEPPARARSAEGGEHRWRPPTPPRPRRGMIRKADSFGSACPQVEASSTALSPVDGTSEDCLTLNVFTPTHRPAARMPVMVWFHGGGFFTGSSSEAQFDTAAFARRDVVLVTANYRLGRLGVFAHPALRAAGQDPLATAAANYGLMDAIAALRWVHQNAAAFGGDPDNVTLFGESAGGGIVNAMLVSPLAKGLFHKAIIQSGSLLKRPRTLAEAEAAGVAFAREAGIPNDDRAAAELRRLPLDALVPRRITSADYVQIVSPVVDGVVLPKAPIDAFSSGEQARVPVLIGSNSLESSVWSWDRPDDDPRTVAIVPLDPEQVFNSLGSDRMAIVEAYRSVVGNDPARLAEAIASDRFMGAPTRLQAELLARSGVPVWVYRFSARPAALRSIVDGAPHGMELFYVFGTLDRLRMRGQATDQDWALSDAMIDYWTAFARQGRPDAERRPTWPEFRTGQIMEFTEQGPQPGKDSRSPALSLLVRSLETQLLQ